MVGRGRYSVTSYYLGDGPKRALELELADTTGDRLTVADTLSDLALAATTLDANAVDAVALLGLVAETAGLVRAGRPRRAVDRRQLAVLPRADAEQEPEDVALLALVKLFKVLVGAHLGRINRDLKGSCRTDRSNG